MKIIFVRHGDPDYEHDTLTEKGIREAKLLSDRTVNWPVTQFYCSPLGRAQKTASYTLERVGREAITHDWMKEFFYPIEDPVTGRVGVPWDFMPEYWTNIPQMYDREGWKETEIYRSNPELLPAYTQVCPCLLRLQKNRQSLSERKPKRPGTAYGFRRRRPAQGRRLTGQDRQHHRDLLPSGRDLCDDEPSAGHVPCAAVPQPLSGAHLRDHPWHGRTPGQYRPVPGAGHRRRQPPDQRR